MRNQLTGIRGISVGSGGWVKCELENLSDSQGLCILISSESHSAIRDLSKKETYVIYVLDDNP